MSTETTPSLIEKELDELYKKAKAGESLGSGRRALAYGLKIVAGGAGLVIATGKAGPVDQWLGIAVLVAVFIDSVFSNHARLLAETEAGHAYAALSRRVKATFNRERGAAVKQGDPAAAAAGVESLMEQAHRQLSDGIDEIEARLAQVDLAALKTLSLDDERKPAGS